MKCQEASDLLVAYLDGEVTPSERTLIQAHLAECDTCRQELTILSALQSRTSQFLQVRAAQAAPSPQAWSRLQARLAGEARPSPSWLPAWLSRQAPGVGRIGQIFQGDVTMKKGFAFATLVALVITLSTVAFVPAVRAQVSDLFGTWFHFKVPGEDIEIAMPGPAEFTPLIVTYLPEGWSPMGGGGGAVGSEKAIELTYFGDKHFITLTQSKAAADKTLPAGRKVTVKGQPAVIVTGITGTITMGLVGEIDQNQQKDRSLVEPTPPVELAVRPMLPAMSASVEMSGTPPLELADLPKLTYTDGKRLTWYVGEVKVEMLSNLSEAEMLKVAESVAPAKKGEGRPPFQPEPPSGGEGEGVIQREGPIELNKP